MKHWACDLIGHPHTAQENCWWLVRKVFREQLGIEMPHIDVDLRDSPENVGAIKRAAEMSGWKPSQDPLPRPWDIVLMTGPTGRHVGVMLEVNGGLHVLHSVSGAGVCLQRLADLRLAGFRDFEFWRQAAC